MLEYELKKQLDNALEQIALYEKLVAVLNQDIANRDSLITAQNDLLELYKNQNKAIKNFETAIVPFVIPPWPYGRF